MSQEAVVRAYLKAMERSDLAGVLECFDGAGLIHSPVYGKVPVRPFYERLFGDTVSAEVTIYSLYSALNDPNRLAAHFGYVWVKTDGSRIVTDLVDLFTFAPGTERISELKII